jgi:hypothetical protein
MSGPVAAIHDSAATSLCGDADTVDAREGCVSQLLSQPVHDSTEFGPDVICVLFPGTIGLDACGEARRRFRKERTVSGIERSGFEVCGSQIHPDQDAL